MQVMVASWAANQTTASCLVEAGAAAAAAQPVGPQLLDRTARTASLRLHG